MSPLMLKKMKSPKAVAPLGISLFCLLFSLIGELYSPLSSPPSSSSSSGPKVSTLEPKLPALQ